LNKDNQFYYTASDKDTVVLGALRLALFIPNPTENTGCFEVKGEAGEQFLLCTQNGACPNVWKTEFTKLFGGDFVGCPPPDGVAKSMKVTMKERLEL